jgi:hypothetical protein
MGTESDGVAMGKPSDVSGIPWTPFQWIVGGLLLIIAALIGVVWADITSDLTSIKMEQRDLRKDMSNTNVELIKAIDGVDKQIAITNQKLDDVLAELRKRKQ